MPQHNEDPMIQEFLSWVEEKSVRGLIDPASSQQPRFLPTDTLKCYLEANEFQNTKKLLRAVFRTKDFPVRAEEVAQKCPRVFCVLLLIGKGEFVRIFLQRRQLQDGLPFRVESPPEGFPHCPPERNGNEFLQRFCEMQWIVCASEMDFQLEEKIFEDEQILPIMVSDRIETGANAVCYKVVLHKQYNLLRGSTSNPARTQDQGDIFANTFVLKTYTGRDAETHYANEVNAFKRVYDQDLSCQSIIRFYGSFKQSNRCNILLEFANHGSLEEFFKKKTPPKDGEDIITFWGCMFQIIEGLHRIHTGKSYHHDDSQTSLLGWHQDVKPDNILVSSQTEGNLSLSAYSFKLADLGTSHFKEQPSSSEGIEDNDSHGTRTYGAPETCRPDHVLQKSKLPVNQNVDSWSLGAVFSEALVWTVDGYEGLKDYRELRRKASKAPGLEGHDCFHDGIAVLEEVHEYHKRMVHHRRAQDVITQPLTSMIEEMLSDVSSRPDTVYLLKKSRWILQKARSRLEKSKSPDVPVTPKRKKPPVHTAGSKSSQSSSSASTTSRGSSQIHNMNDSPLAGRSSRTPSQHANLQDYLPESTAQSEFQRHTSIRSDSRGIRAQGRHEDESEYPTNSLSGLPIGFHHPGSPRSYSNNFASSYATHQATLSDPLGDRRQTFGRQQEHDPRPISTGQIHSPLGTTLVQRQDFGAQRSMDAQRTPNHIPAPIVDPSTSRHVSFHGSEHVRSMVGPSDHFNRDLSSNINSSPHRNDWEAGIFPPGRTALSPEPTLDHNFRGRHQIIPTSPQPLDAEPRNWTPVVPSARQYQSPDSYPLESRRTFRNGINGNIQPSEDLPARNRRSSPLRRSPPVMKSPSYNIPHLPLATAINWKTSQKKGKKTVTLDGTWLFERLRLRDHVFLVDDALSMRNHWTDMLAVFDILSYMVKSADPDGIDLIFTISPNKYNSKDRFGRNSSSKLVRRVEDRKSELQGVCDISYKLNDILGSYESELKSQHYLRKNSSPFAAPKEIRPMSLYVLTDGNWDPDCDAERPIKRLAATLIELKCDPKQVGIQFISFGDDESGLEKLEHLDDNLGQDIDIVDTTPSNGNVWKMLFGAINKSFDRSPNTFSEPSPIDSDTQGRVR